MNITVTRTWDLANIELLTADDMREIGLLARERIVTRTMRGVDADGAPFQPYSAAYAAQKGSTAVNLQVSGNMLNHLQIVEIDVEGDEKRVRLGWTQ